MSKRNKLFSGSIGGFKKSQVVEYIEELNRKAKMTKEESDYEITRLENEIAELSQFKYAYEETKEKYESLSLRYSDTYSQLEKATEKLTEIITEFEDVQRNSSDLKVQNESLLQEVVDLRAKCEQLESENKMLSDDVSNQRGIILAHQNELDSALSKLAQSESETGRYKAKAEKYDSDRLFAGDICERAKNEATKVLADARDKASDILAKARIEADKTLAESEAELAENMKKLRYLYKRREELLGAFRKVKDAAGGFYDNIASAFSDGEE